MRCSTRSLAKIKVKHLRSRSPKKWPHCQVHPRERLKVSQTSIKSTNRSTIRLQFSVINLDQTSPCTGKRNPKVLNKPVWISQAMAPSCFSKSASNLPSLSTSIKVLRTHLMSNFSKIGPQKGKIQTLWKVYFRSDSNSHRISRTKDC